MNHAMRNVSSAYADSGRPRSACASAQFDEGIRCPLTESLDTTEFMTREHRPGWYFAHAQDDLKPRILRSFEGTFSLDGANITFQYLGTFTTRGMVNCSQGPILYIYIYPWNLFFNKRSGAVVMSSNSEGLGAAVVTGVGSSFTQSSGISYFSLYTFFLKYLHQYWSWARILCWSLFKS